MDDDTDYYYLRVLETNTARSGHDRRGRPT